jgi:hypothetical protein
MKLHQAIFTSIAANRVRLAAVLLCLSAVTISCHAVRASSSQVPAPTIEQVPPVPTPTPPEDTTRYAEWLRKEGKPLKGKASEDLHLRIGDWGFFEDRIDVWHFGDRAALDLAGHVVTASENSDWYALLSTSGLNAHAALTRVGWLASACELDSQSAAKFNKRQISTAPTLTVAADGSITFQALMVFTCYSDPPNLNDVRRMTITSTAGGTKIVIEPLRKP